MRNKAAAADSARRCTGVRHTASATRRTLEKSAYGARCGKHVEETLMSCGAPADYRFFCFRFRHILRRVHRVDAPSTVLSLDRRDALARIAAPSSQFHSAVTTRERSPHQRNHQRPRLPHRSVDGRGRQMESPDPPDAGRLLRDDAVLRRDARRGRRALASMASHCKWSASRPRRRRIVTSQVRPFRAGLSPLPKT